MSRAGAIRGYQREKYNELPGRVLTGQAGLGISMAVYKALNSFMDFSSICSEIENLVLETRKIAGPGYFKNDGITRHKVMFGEDVPCLTKS